MAKRCYLIGAGFSCLAGLPLMKDLFQSMKDHVNSSRNIENRDFKAEFNRFIGQISSNFPELLNDVEAFFTIFDISLFLGADSIFGRYFKAKIDLQVFRDKLSGLLISMFGTRIISYYHNPDNGVRKYYQAFSKIINDGDSIITFNYDTIIERELWEQNRWTFLDGYGIPKRVYDFESAFKRYPYLLNPVI